MIGVNCEDQETTGEEIAKIAIVHIEKEIEVAPLQQNETGRGGIDEETKNMAELERETKAAMNIGANIGITSHLGEIDGTEIRKTPGGYMSDHTRGLLAVLHTGTEVPTAIAIEYKNVNLDILPAPFPVLTRRSRTNLGGQSGKMHRHMAPAALALEPARGINKCPPCLL